MTVGHVKSGKPRLKFDGPKPFVKHEHWLKMNAAEEMYQALKAIFEDNCFYHKEGDERAYRLATEALRKAEGK